MKKHFLWVTLLAAVISCAAMVAGKKSADPVVMKIGGDDVHRSEFEYLYKKNNAQISSGMSLDDYIDLFVTYKLKVKAAREAGLDTTRTYLRDMEQYTNQLAAPYMQDPEMRDSLLQAAYDHHRNVYTISYFLVPQGRNEDERARFRTVIDSVYALATNGGDLDAMIAETAAMRRQDLAGAHIRFPAGDVPYVIEDQAATTPIGQLSPVINTPFGLLFMRVDDRTPNPGEVKVRHILKLTADKSPEEVAAQRAAIDSIARLLKNGGDFVAIASVETEDPSGRGNGGDLPWFSVGRMVRPFEDASYALKKGEISEPVETAYGYHIILKEDARGVQSFDEMRQRLLDELNRDYRNGSVRARAAEKYAAKNKLKVNGKLMSEAQKLVESKGLGSDAMDELKAMKGNLITLGGQSVTLADVVNELSGAQIVNPSGAFDQAVAAVRSKLIFDQMKATLPERDTDYRNLSNEYSDGLLLFEISTSEVWDRAKKDMEGLEKYYEAHKSDYTWRKPHYIGYVVSAVDDSVAAAAVDYLSTLTVEDQQLATELRKKFGVNAKIEKVNAEQGDYPIIDYIAFGGVCPKNDHRWKAYRQFRGRIVDQPETAMDVKGRVSVDYQKQLEEEWLKSLRQRYPVKINRDALKGL